MENSVQLANEILKTPSSSYCGRERTIELTVKKELPVLGVEANDIGWQHIHGEIRRKPRNIFAVMTRKALPAFARRTSFSSRDPRQRSTTKSAVTREPSRA